MALKETGCWNLLWIWHFKGFLDKVGVLLVQSHQDTSHDYTDLKALAFHPPTSPL